MTNGTEIIYECIAILGLIKNWFSAVNGHLHFSESSGVSCHYS